MTHRFFHLNLVDFDSVKFVFEFIVECEFIPIFYLLTLHRQNISSLEMFQHNNPKHCYITIILKIFMSCVHAFLT